MCSIAVSYTHLDVYKRQRYGLAGSILHFPRYAREEHIARERTEELLSIFHMESHADERRLVPRVMLTVLSPLCARWKSGM